MHRRLPALAIALALFLLPAGSAFATSILITASSDSQTTFRTNSNTNFTNLNSTLSTFSVFPFSPTTNYGALTNATSTAVWLQGGVQASSTSRFANVRSDNATTTGSFASTGSTTISSLSLTTALPNSQLANSSLTVNGTSISLGSSGTVSAASSTLLGDFNTNSGLSRFTAGLISTGSTTLVNATTSNSLAVLGLSSLSGGFVSVGSSTINGNATSTGTLFASTASSTNLYGAGLFSCSGAGNALTWSSGVFGCTTITTSAAPAFTVVSPLLVSTSTAIYDSLGFLASSTSYFGSVDVDQFGAYRQGGRTLGYASSTNSTTIFGLGAGGQAATTTGGLGSTAFNTAIGFAALAAETTGKNNTALGAYAGKAFTSTNYNTAIGTLALQLNTGADNTAVGSGALGATSAGSRNVTIGSFGNANQGGSGSGNINIGAYADIPSNSASGQLNIGNVIYGTGLYNTAVQTFAETGNGHIGIGTSSPFATLSVSTNASSTDLFSFVIASSTVGLATTTLFTVSNTGSTTISRLGACSGGNALNTTSAGTVICGPVTATGDGVGNWFPVTSNYGANANSTTTPVWFNATPFSLFASSTAIFSAINTSYATSTFASSTALTATTLFATNATTSALGVTGTGTSTFSGGIVISAGGLTVSTLNSGSCDVKADTNGKLTCGTDSTGSATFPFTSTTNFGLLANSTSTPIWFTKSLQASSTSQFDAGAFWSGLAVGATTTPYALLSVHANSGATTTLFAIGSSTSAGVVTTLFSINNTGKIIGTDATNNWTGAITPTRAFVLTTGTTTTWQATTSGAYVPSLVMPFAGTLRTVQCAATSTQAFLGVTVYINTTKLTPSYFVSSSTKGKITFTANNTFVSGDTVSALFGTTTTDANVTSDSCTFTATET